MKYIDTHGHLNSEEFNLSYEKNIKEAKEKGVDKIIIPGTNKKDSYKAIEISKKFNNVFALAALHPNDGNKIEDIDWLKNINPKEIIGVGECGIDLFRETNPPLKIQKEIFIEHIKYALKNNLPLIIHSRNAEKETYDILKKEEFKNIKFVIHCCTMNWKWTEKFVNLGGYISFSGIVTFKNSFEIQKVAKKVPLNRILSETDSPFLTPSPFRGKMNKPEFVIYTANYIAKIRGEKDGEVLNAMYKNACKIFNI